jgi:hypothetical protein
VTRDGSVAELVRAIRDAAQPRSTGGFAVIVFGLVIVSLGVWAWIIGR